MMEIKQVYTYDKTISIKDLSRIDFDGEVFREECVYLLLKHATEESRKRGCIVTSFQMTYLRDYEVTLEWSEIEIYNKTVSLGKDKY